MLTEDEKARIRLEEIFRERLREELRAETPRGGGRRTIGFFNSALGIWLLSSVVLGAVTWTYSRWSENRTEARKNHAAIEKLDVEIAARLQRFQTILENAPTMMAYYFALWSLDNPAAIEKLPAGVFPEYANRGLRSLLWELQTRVPVSERASVVSALHAAEHLSMRGAGAVRLFDKDAPQDQPVDAKELQATRQVLLSSLQQARWSAPR